MRRRCVIVLGYADGSEGDTSQSFELADRSAASVKAALLRLGLSFSQVVAEAIRVDKLALSEETHGMLASRSSRFHATTCDALYLPSVPSDRCVIDSD